MIGQEEDLGWSYVEYEHENMTESLLIDEDDQDYCNIVLYPSRSYAKIPCGNRGHLRATSYNSDDVIDAERCSICLDDLICNDDDEMTINNNMLMMPCNHLFHNRCIISWLTTKNASTCPLCRNTIQIYPDI